MLLDAPLDIAVVPAGSLKRPREASHRGAVPTGALVAPQHRASGASRLEMLKLRVRAKEARAKEDFAWGTADSLVLLQDSG